MMRKFILIIALLSAFVLLVSCSNYLNSADDFYGGDVIDAEMLSSIAESVFASDESLRPNEPYVDEYASKDKETTVDSSSDGVTEETPTESGTDENSEPETEVTTEDVTTEEETTKRVHDGKYYWTKSGKVYHKWSDCGYLKNSDEVFSGSFDDAQEAGKENLCSSCAKK